MTSIRQRLKDADPVGAEQPLALSEIQAMRRRVVAAVDDRRLQRVRSAQLRLAVAAIVLVASVVAPLAHLWESKEAQRLAARAAEHASEPSNTRQLQFITPGGTRVIWVFNPGFQP